MLKIENLHVYYGGIHALRGINMEVADGQIISLIGANGAGKEYDAQGDNEPCAKSRKVI